MADQVPPLEEFHVGPDHPLDLQLRAVGAHMRQLSAEQANAANTDVSETDLASMVDEALQWARKPMMREVLDTNILFGSKRPFCLCKPLLFGFWMDDLDIRRT